MHQQAHGGKGSGVTTPPTVQSSKGSQCGCAATSKVLVRRLKESNAQRLWEITIPWTWPSGHSDSKIPTICVLDYLSGSLIVRAPSLSSCFATMIPQLLSLRPYAFVFGLTVRVSSTLTSQVLRTVSRIL